MKKIYEELAELLEVDSLNDSDILEEFESWNSLTRLSIIAYASESYGKILLTKDLNEAGTVGALIKLISNEG